MRPLVLVLACAVLAAAPGPVRAAPGSRKEDARKEEARKEEARTEFERGETNYKLGRFQEALDAYTHAFELFPAPALLFDIGQCHRNLKHYDRAVFFFEGYLREETNPGRRRLAQQLLLESKTALEKQQADAAAQAGTPPAPPLAVPEASAAPVTKPPPEEPAPRPQASPAPALLTAQPAPAEPPHEPVTSRWWFWTAVGVGVLAVAAGAFAYSRSGDTVTVLPGGSVGTLDRR